MYARKNVYVWLWVLHIHQMYAIIIIDVEIPLLEEN